MGGAQKYWTFAEKYRSKSFFLQKTKIARMVYRNVFYDMGLELSDEKNELWTKNEK